MNTNLLLLEEGKTYFFKTLAHYYLGRVKHVTPTHAVLDDASEVYETGPLADFYGEGKVKACERLPDGWAVPISGTAFGGWPHDLPKKAIGISA